MPKTKEHPLSVFLRTRREELGLMIIDLEEKIKRDEWAERKVSQPFLSQLEGNFREQAANVGFDVLWSIGLALSVDPMLLYLLSRQEIDRKYIDPKVRSKLFEIKSMDKEPHVSAGEHPLCKFLKDRREELEIGIRDLSRRIEKESLAIKKVSNSYISQVETNFRGFANIVNFDVLWSLGIALKVDPMILYILSRCHIDRKYLNPKARMKLFKIQMIKSA